MFTKLLDDLKAAGMSDQSIALAVETSQPNITRLRNGDVVQPLYAMGQRIVDLHAKVCRDDATNSPANAA